jgi:aromatic ring-opening dioxygenase catalytic subunit (LigB family)
VNATKRLPTLFIPHGGGPCFFMDPPAAAPHMWDGLAAYLRGIDASLGVRPKAVLVISGHWENPLPTLNVSPKPGLLFDYYGFPEHTYRLKYPAAGAPELAERVRANPNAAWTTASSCPFYSSIRMRTFQSCSSRYRQVSIRSCIWRWDVPWRRCAIRAY